MVHEGSGRAVWLRQEDGAEMTRVACIDIGTVTARLAVADVEGGRVSLTRTGLIAEAAAVRVLACVDSYLAAARQARAPRICCTLTSAARDAANSDALLAELAARGLHAQVIPGEVEGSLTFLGVAQDFADREILVADNGGGSTEIAVGSMGAERGLALDRVRSVDVGCRRMTEKFLSAGDPPSADDVERARQWARGMFDDAVAAEGVRELAPEPGSVRPAQGPPCRAQPRGRGGSSRPVCRRDGVGARRDGGASAEARERDPGRHDRGGLADGVVRVRPADRKRERSAVWALDLRGRRGGRRGEPAGLGSGPERASVGRAGASLEGLGAPLEAS